MLKGYKYRIYPTNEQEVLLAKHFGSVRWIYNWALELKTKTYEATKKNLSYYDLSKMLPILKKTEEFSWLGEVGSASIQQSLQNLDQSFQRFFKGLSEFPQQKKKNKSKNCFNVTQDIFINWNHGRCFIQKFREGIKIKLHRKFVGSIKNATVSKNKAGQYFISFVVEDFLDVPKQVVLESMDDVLGIDVGIKDFCITSDAEVVKNPKHLKKSSRKLARLQRAHSKKKKGSKNKEKSRKRLAKQHNKVVNQRLDHLHKTSSRLVSENQAVAREDLNVKGMMKNHKLAKAIADASWGEFDRQLAYKLKRQGKVYIEIGRFEASSKTCSQCDYYHSALCLKDCEWECPGCHAVHDRDVNAAINIKRWGWEIYLDLRVSQEMREVGKISMSSRKSVSLRKRKDMKRKANHIDAEVVSEQKGMTAMSPEVHGENHG